jgi:hypothetical protein
MSDPTLRPLPNEAIVIRIVPPSEPYYDAGKKKPHPKAFELSTADKEQDPPRFSVYDRSKTTIEQAKAITNKPYDTYAFALGVAKIRQIDNGRLDVVEDPLKHPLNSLPGAEGHCGVTGLHRLPEEPKARTENIRWQLTEISEIIV